MVTDRLENLRFEISTRDSVWAVLIDRLIACPAWPGRAGLCGD